MKKRKIPMRQCVATNARFPKQDMFRIVKTAEGNVMVDLTGKIRGRGAYLSRQKDAIIKALKKRILDRHLEVEVPLTVYEHLLQLLREDEH